MKLPLHLSAGLLLCCLGFALESSAQQKTLALKRPVAVQKLSTARHVVTANRAGSLSVVDLKQGTVLRETKLGEQFSDLLPIPRHGDYFLATDEATHDLLALHITEQRTELLSQLKVSHSPVSLAASSEGSLAAVASLWARRVTLVTVGENHKLKTERVIDLPFAPRKLIFLPGDKQLTVFDSFGGRLAVVEVSSGKITQQREFPGHAVRGLVLSPDRQMLLATHQMLNPHGHANRNDIHWGLVMNNDLRWMKLESLLRPEQELYAGGRVQPLGIPGRGGGDPMGVAINSEGIIAACLGGANQVMIGSANDETFERVRVGQRPIAITISDDNRLAIVANMFGDSLSLIDLASRRVTKTIPLGAKRERTSLELGEELFHDARFSHEGWMSCHSCHTDGHSNFTANDNLSDGGFGAPKLVISLLGHRGTAPFAWEGTAADLNTQIRNSIFKTMQSDYKTLPEHEIAALAEYVESLPPPPSVPEACGTVDPAAATRGAILFKEHDCQKCHAGPTFTVPTLEEVGLSDELGHKRFNPPSLLGAGQRDAFLHDGRAKSLVEVFLNVKHPHNQTWSPTDAEDLAAYLSGL